MATRKKALGNTTGARRKTSSRQAPPRSAEIWSRGTALHHMPFATRCLDLRLMTRGYLGNLQSESRGRELCFLHFAGIAILPKAGCLFSFDNCVTRTPGKRKGEIRSPLAPIKLLRSLLLIVQFHRVARVHIFQREDNHGRR
jgi:hypothetical protein